MRAECPWERKEDEKGVRPFVIRLPRSALRRPPDAWAPDTAPLVPRRARIIGAYLGGPARASGWAPTPAPPECSALACRPIKAVAYHGML